MSIQENVATFVTKLPKVILLCVVIYLIVEFQDGQRGPEESRGES